MRKLFLLLVLSLSLAVSAFAKDKWQVGDFRVVRDDKLARQIFDEMQKGYHIHQGTEDWTCIGGDEHNAPDCEKDYVTDATRV